MFDSYWVIFNVRIKNVILIDFLQYKFIYIIIPKTHFFRSCLCLPLAIVYMVIIASNNYNYA